MEFKKEEPEVIGVSRLAEEINNEQVKSIDVKGNGIFRDVTFIQHFGADKVGMTGMELVRQ